MDLLQMLMSGVTGAGNILDVPGSMVRDAIAGENPFDQLVSPWASENRVGGRDLARRLGMIGEEDTSANALGGLALEMLLDPTTYVGLGALGAAAKQAGVGGKLLSAAGRAKTGAKAGLAAVDDAGRLAAKGRPRTGAIGNVRRSMVPDQVVDEIPYEQFGDEGFGSVVSEGGSHNLFEQGFGPRAAIGADSGMPRHTGVKVTFEDGSVAYDVVPGLNTGHAKWAAQKWFPDAVSIDVVPEDVARIGAEAEKMAFDDVYALEKFLPSDMTLPESMMPWKVVR